MFDQDSEFRLTFVLAIVAIVVGALSSHVGGSNLRKFLILVISVVLSFSISYQACRGDVLVVKASSDVDVVCLLDEDQCSDIARRELVLRDPTRHVSQVVRVFRPRLHESSLCVFEGRIVYDAVQRTLWLRPIGIDSASNRARTGSRALGPGPEIKVTLDCEPTPEPLRPVVNDLPRQDAGSASQQTRLNTARRPQINTAPPNNARVIACGEGLSSCSGSPCVDLATSTEHCGRCDNRCPNTPNAESVCIGGHCSIRCLAGWHNNNRSDDDGCESAVSILNEPSRRNEDDTADSCDISNRLRDCSLNGSWGRECDSFARTLDRRCRAQFSRTIGELSSCESWQTARGYLEGRPYLNCVR